MRKRSGSSVHKNLRIILRIHVSGTRDDMLVEVLSTKVMARIHVRDADALIVSCPM